MRYTFIFFMMISFNIFASNIAEDISKSGTFYEAEISQALEDCNKDQRTMNICALRDAFLAKREMMGVFLKVLKTLPPSCDIPLKTAQERWERKMESKCMSTVDEEIGQGTIRPTILNGCRTDAMKKRTDELHKNITCKICKECIAIPY
jgi:uncharacterized protein YecT (DUF1311 family)